jgi:pSer/pThr/pTyr-binding forkhead associated (FHA) protein
MLNFCPHCKSPIPREGSSFCNQCGGDLRSLSPGPSEKSAGVVQYSGTAETPNEGVISISPPNADRPSKSMMVVSQDEIKSDQPHALLYILLRDGSVIERDLVQEETKIGKGPFNDIILADASVSNTHARINFTGTEYTISDLGSRNGTYLNDARLTEPRPLHHGDLIKMGHCTITFRLKEAGDTQSTTRTQLLDPSHPPPPPTPPPMPKTPAITEETLAAALVSAGLVAQTEIDRLRGADSKGRRLYRALLDENLVTETGLRDLMSRTFNILPIELKTMEVDTEAASALRPQFLRDRLVCPIMGQAYDRLILAVADPTDKATIDEVERLTRRKPALRLAMPGEITTQLDNYFTPRLIGALPSGEKIEAMLSQSEMEIGKAAHNRLVIADPTVSSTHAIVLVHDGGYNIVDLGSSNGTFINGQRLGGDAHTLRHGDKIQLGQVMLTFRNPAETTENRTAKLSLQTLEEIRKRAALRPPTGVSTDPVSWVNPPMYPTPVQGLATPPTLSSEDEEEKRRKKKKKEKNSWVNAMSRIVAQVLGAAVMLFGSYILVNRSLQTTREQGTGGAGNVSKLAKPGSFSSFEGLQLEASGAAWVNGTDMVVLVSDSRPGQIFLMRLDESGRQSGNITPLDLGASTIDPEGITYGRPYFYIIGSQSDPAAGGQNALLRFALDTESRTVRGQAEVIPDLRSFLLQGVPELKGIGDRPGRQDGVNIEGIGWDPIHERLLLGLRSPLINGRAVIVPTKLRDPLGPFNTNNLQLLEPRTIQLDLGGQGIRDLDYNTQLKSFLILSGATELARKTDFGLWEWNGDPDQSKPEARPRKEHDLDERAKPEGITHVTIGNRNFVFIVGDASKYLKLDYTTSN